MASENMGPGVNGVEGVGQQLVSEEMLFKLSKKIAQLTKVIYSLNTKNDDLEFDMERLRIGYEDKLQKDMNVPLPPEIAMQETPQTGGKKKESHAEAELRRDLKKAKHQLKQYETKIRVVEEEHKQAMTRISDLSTSHQTESSLKSQLEILQKQVEKERFEHKRRFDKLEEEKDKLVTEKDILAINNEELGIEKSYLQSQLSAAKETEELNACGKKLYDDDDELKEQLISTIDKLTTDNSHIRSELDLVLKSQQESRSKDGKTIQTLQSQLDQQKQKHEEEMSTVKVEKAQFEKSLNDSREDFESEINLLVEEKNTFQNNYDEMKKHYEEEVKHFQHLAERREEEIETLNSEVMKIKEDLLVQQPKHRKEVEDTVTKLQTCEAEVNRLEAELGISEGAGTRLEEQITSLRNQLDKEQATAREKEVVNDRELSEARDSLAKLQKEMGQVNEKCAGLEGKFKNVEGERDGLKKKMKEAEIKVEVLNKKKESESQTRDQHVKQLESALEEALVEREQILEACEKEIEQERNIAIELEQKMMEDFEWKLREVEGGYKTKIKTLEESIENTVAQTERDIGRQKDAELTKMCIDARRDMEEKLKTERTTLKTTLETSAKKDKDSALAQLTLQKDRESRMQQRTWQEETDRLNKEIKRLQSQIEKEVGMQVSKSRAEFDQKLFETNRKHTQIVERYQEDYDHMKENLEGQMNRLRADETEKIEEYEAKVADLMSGKVDTIFKMKDEVETEFAERMEGLREIYRKEICQQQDLHVKETTKWKGLEDVLHIKLTEKKTESEDNIAYYSQREAEYETKIDELMTRLQEQTTNYMKLQSEFDNYEWYTDGEEENEHNTDKRRSRESLASRGRPPTRPPTREEVVRTVEEEKEEEEEDEEEDEEEEEQHETEHSVEEPPTVTNTLEPIPRVSPAPSLDPDIPPRRAAPSSGQDNNVTKRNSTASAKSTSRRSQCSQS